MLARAFSSAVADDVSETVDELRLAQLGGPGESLSLLGLLEVLTLEADHVSVERPVRLRVDVRVANPDLARRRVEEIPERDWNQPAALDRRQRFGAAVEQEARGPVAEAPAVLDVEPTRRGAAELVAEILGHDAGPDTPRGQARHHPRLEEPRQLQLFQAHVPVRITLHRPQRLRVELLEETLEKLDPQTLGTVERDAYGNVRLEELELARLLKTRVVASLAARGIGTGIVAKD